MAGRLEVEHRAQFGALALVALAVLVRIAAVGAARFTGDESYFWATARNIARGHAWPVYGPPLTGSDAYHPGPIFYYLMAVPQFLGASPWLGGIFVALLHGLAGWILYRLASEARGPRAGLSALGLFVFAPWDVLYGDRIWLSCVAPVWGAATLYAAHRARGGGAWLGVFVFLALVCPQLHMSAPVVWVASAVLLFWGAERSIWLRAASVRAVGVGGALSVLAYAPAIYWEATHQLQNTLAIIQKGGGRMPLEGILAAPLRVFGYAILYASSEIGYHFARGYWSPFSETVAYFSRAGVSRALEQHGAFWAAANGVSVALAAWGWGAAIKEVSSALRQRGGARAPRLEDRLVVALVAALVAATALMMVARKEYFPHYTNLLMPLALLPLAFSLDRVLAARPSPARGLGLTSQGLRLTAWALRVAAAISVAAMASSTFRYYRDVDALNGLEPTAGMVARVLAEGEPVSLEFTGFHNQFAWELLASVAHGRPLSVDGRAPVRFRIENRAPFVGVPPAGAQVFGPVLLLRTEREPRR